MPWVRKMAPVTTAQSVPFPSAVLEDVLAPQPATIQAALAGGLKAGDVLAAPLAPKDGIITAVVVPASTVKLSDGGTITTAAKEPLFVVAGRLLKDSPTFQKLRVVIIAAWTVFAGFVGVKILANGSVFGLDWLSIARGGLDAALLSGLAAYGISLKTSDHNLVVKAPAVTAT